MLLNLPKSINRFFWTLFPFVLFFRSYYNIHNKWQIQSYGFNELEDFGRLILVIVLGACESALTVVFMWFMYRLIRGTSS